ncbi:MAG TPA: 3'-5' exonuclease, partial [Actinomycetota bacterium]|nr:3'-5' exonuclease [Actinomycetota bacterium]
TGLDLRRDTIVSFGLVPIREGRVEVGDSVYQLVDPGDVALSHASIAVHMLRPVDLKGAPSPEAARGALADALRRRFLVTWFETVEAAFLAKLFESGRKEWLRRSVDVRRLVIALLGDGEGGSLTLTAAAERFGVPVARPHHALDDSLVTAQLFLVTASKLAGGRATVRDLLRAGRR